MTDQPMNSTAAGGKETAFPLVLGVDTCGDRTNAADGEPLSHAQTIRNVVEEGVLAEQVGVDFFGIGEHHTNYLPMPAGDVVLASIAARTHRIHLGSAVTVLSSDDPVRVFQRYSTLNALSSGRAEVILGRGSSIESFPLFGYDLADYEQLFEEKTALFAQLLEGADSFAYETGPQGALYVGSPEAVAQKIATNLRTLGATRFDLKYGAGGLTHETLMTNIELYGRQVIPRVRELMKK
jgi:alkanesulfonate monooxygenase SsuD/methylene tetrahydromethanopterin reductase-like flavin-dependent oxidoreductase (luciferase family)